MDTPGTTNEQASPSHHRDCANKYLNRELSWIDFNRRVLDQAFDEHNLLLERIKFLAIFSSNLDEFFMIRLSGIKQQIAAGVKKRSPDGLTPDEQLVAIRRVLQPLIESKRRFFLEVLMPQLKQHGIYIYTYNELNQAQRDTMTRYFKKEIFPVLTPLVFDPSHPFPHISNLSRNLAVVLHDTEYKRNSIFARVKIPEVLPRLIPLASDFCHLDEPDAIMSKQNYCFVWLLDVIIAHLHILFPGMEIDEAYSFRVTRDADMEIEEDEADDLMRTIEEGVRQRHFGKVVRIEVDGNMPDHIRQILLSNMKVASTDIYQVNGPLGFADLIQLYKLDRPDLKDSPILPASPSILHSGNDIFATIQQHDILLHHPYDSFSPVIDFIQAAATDPQVLAIKQTLYRVGQNSPIVNALMQAREHGKQVAVLVELKARFDEENNIVWARALESAGVHVVYGVLGLKTHCKIALVVRKEGEDIRLYTHLGTGNYNDVTARIYTDLGLLTCRHDIGDDAVELFNMLTTGHIHQRSYQKLFVAPLELRPKFAALIQREIVVHQQHGNGHLIFKMNSLVDPEMTELLYLASQAGVRIDLIPRGICCLRPGVPGLSENIRVKSIVGRFLEHNRIFYFHNGGSSEIYLGSADLMQRNLDRRVETLFPVEDPVLREFIRHVLLETYLHDNINSYVLQPDGTYIRSTPESAAFGVNSQHKNMGYHTQEQKIVGSTTNICVNEPMLSQ